MADTDASDFVEVYLAPNFAVGEELRELLVSNQIQCLLAPGSMLQPQDVRVQCHPADAARARELIDAYVEPSENESVETCSECGKVLAEDDVECPACGAPVEAAEEEPS